MGRRGSLPPPGSTGGGTCAPPRPTPPRPAPPPPPLPNALHKVVLAPDPDLIPHLLAHGVTLDTGVDEADRVGRALIVQVGGGGD